MQKQLKAFTESRQFQFFFIGIILLSGVIVGLDSYPKISAEYGTILHSLDRIILGLFVFEICLKLASFWPRVHEFFKDGWNVFDFIIVGACFLPFDGQSITDCSACGNYPRAKVDREYTFKKYPVPRVYRCFVIYSVLHLWLFGHVLIP